METLKYCLELLEAGSDVMLVTVLKATSGTPGKEGFKLALSQDGRMFGTVGGGALEHRAIEDARKLLERRENSLVTYNLADLGMRCGGEATLAFEYLRARRSFVLFGGGHIGRALAPILESLGFRVTVYDSRPEMRELLASGQSARSVVIGGYEDISAVKPSLETSEFCFIATHAHQHDYEVLKQVLLASSAYRYIGLIGSQAKVRATRQRLKEEGVPIPECLFAPVGLAIGAATPAEIAVSIGAEVVAILHGAQAPHMRDR